jgi:hypothetical protein
MFHFTHNGRNKKARGNCSEKLQIKKIRKLLEILHEKKIKCVA